MRPRRPLAGFRWFTLLLPLLAVLLTSAPASTSTTASSSDDEPKQAFTLAVVRRDSIAIPFATYDGKRWRNDWPYPQPRLTAPIALTDMPKKWWSGIGPIKQWTFLPLESSESAPRTLETTAPALFYTHCRQGLGVRTSYSTRDVIPPPDVQPYPKAGLAMAAAAGSIAPKITPIEILDVASHPLVDPLARTLVSAVAEKENVTIGTYTRAGEGWTHPYSKEERAETPFRIEALYKITRGVGDQDVYYFEGLKHYAIRDRKSAAAKTESAPGKEPCDLVTFVGGWLIGREDELLKDKTLIKPKQVTVHVTSCDFASSNFMLPLGAVLVKDKTYWVAQMSNWTHEHYSVFDININVKDDDDLIMPSMIGDGGSCRQRPD